MCEGGREREAEPHLGKGLELFLQLGVCLLASLHLSLQLKSKVAHTFKSRTKLDRERDGALSCQHFLLHSPPPALPATHLTVNSNTRVIHYPFPGQHATLTSHHHSPTSTPGLRPQGTQQERHPVLNGTLSLSPSLPPYLLQLLFDSRQLFLLVSQSVLKLQFGLHLRQCRLPAERERERERERENT